MRWSLLLLVPCIASATDLSGAWAEPRKEGFAGFNRVAIVDVGDRIYFHYESDNGHRCEVLGLARRRSDLLYVFVNTPEHHTSPGHEGYGFEEHRDCELSFERVGDVLRVRSSGNCKSFCGMNGSIGGDLHKLSD